MLLFFFYIETVMMMMKMMKMTMMMMSQPTSLLSHCVTKQEVKVANGMAGLITATDVGIG